MSRNRESTLARRSFPGYLSTIFEPIILTHTCRMDISRKFAGRYEAQASQIHPRERGGYTIVYHTPCPDCGDGESCYLPAEWCLEHLVRKGLRVPTAAELAGIR